MPRLKPTPDIIPTNPPASTEKPPEIQTEKPKKTRKTKQPNAPRGRNASLPSSLTALSPEKASLEMADEYNPLVELLSVGKNPLDIDARSEVNELQIIHMARARIIAKHFDIPALDQLVKHVLTLSLSKSRKSRKEFVAAFQAAHMSDNEAQAGILANMTAKLRG